MPRRSEDTTLYPVTIIDSPSTTSSGSDRVKIHYLGYSSNFDERRCLADLVQLDSPYIGDQYNFNRRLAISLNLHLHVKGK